MTNWSDCWVDTGGMASTEDAKPKAKAVAADATKARFLNAPSYVCFARANVADSHMRTVQVCRTRPEGEPTNCTVFSEKPLLNHVAKHFPAARLRFSPTNPDPEPNKKPRRERKVATPARPVGPYPTQWRRRYRRTWPKSASRMKVPFP